jgi:hypothetical protein
MKENIIMVTKTAILKEDKSIRGKAGIGADRRVLP